MSAIQLSLAVTPNENTLPISNGSIRAGNIDFMATVLDPSDLFWRQLEFAEFDVSEMSLSSLLILYASGNTDWVGIPIFTSRRFFHIGMLVNKNSGITSPEDLKGKLVGVPEYQQTAALWGRGVLQHEFGVHAGDMEWLMERTPEKSHGGATGFNPPQGVNLSYMKDGRTIGKMLITGELDAAIHYIPRQNLLDRNPTDIRLHSAIRTLFPNPVEEGIRYYQKTGIYPINHGMVVRRSLLEKYPWITLNIYNAFTEAKNVVRQQNAHFMETYYKLGLLPMEVKSQLLFDPFEYGIKANRRTLETISQYSYEQGLTSRKVAIEEVFAPNTFEL